METSQRKSLKTLRFSEQCRNVFYDEDGVLSSEWGPIRYGLKIVKESENQGILKVCPISVVIDNIAFVSTATDPFSRGKKSCGELWL